MKIGLDTTAVIDIISGEFDLSQYASETFVICDMVYFESSLGKNVQRQVDLIAAKLKNVTCNFAIARSAASIFRDLKKNGNEIGQADCLIAATYLENGVTKILTRNKKYFDKIPGVEAVSY